MRSVKSRFPEAVQDFVLSDTTLEEVFLAFARSKRGGGGGQRRYYRSMSLEESDDERMEGEGEGAEREN